MGDGAQLVLSKDARPGIGELRAGQLRPDVIDGRSGSAQRREQAEELVPVQVPAVSKLLVDYLDLGPEKLTSSAPRPARSFWNRA
jgi:hypothetical protein